MCCLLQLVRQSLDLDLLIATLLKTSCAMELSMGWQDATTPMSLRSAMGDTLLGTGAGKVS